MTTTRSYDRAREADKPYRAWYRTARWKTLRRFIWVRDNGLCGICGHLTDPGDFDCDHCKKHEGDPALFWDPDNLQVLHPKCHAIAKQRDEQRGFEGGSDLAGRPLDPDHPWNRQTV